MTGAVCFCTLCARDILFLCNSILTLRGGNIFVIPIGYLASSLQWILVGFIGRSERPLLDNWLVSGSLFSANCSGILSERWSSWFSYLFMLDNDLNCVVFDVCVRFISVDDSNNSCCYYYYYYYYYYSYNNNNVMVISGKFINVLIEESEDPLQTQHEHP
jgi:hypothetical protein